MNSTSLPEDWRSQLAGYVLNDLTPEKAVLVEHWLGQYPEVAAELETLQTTWESLPNGLEPVVPPPGVRDRILTAVLTGDKVPRELAASGIEHRNRAENRAVYGA